MSPFSLTRVAATRTAAFALAALCAATTPALAQTTIKVGHVETATSSTHLTLQKIAEVVSERTDGELRFAIFPQSQLGGQREMVEAVQLGTLEATSGPVAFMGGFNPLVSILDIPFLYPDDELKAQQIRESAFGQRLCESFDTRGATCIALVPNGRKSLTANAPLPSLDALSGKTFRVMESPVLVEAMGGLGAKGVPIPFGELYTSLQTGLIDGQENPLDTIYNMKLHEVQSHLVVSRHGAIDNVILFNPRFWSGLTEDQRAIIRTAILEAVPERLASKEAAAREALEKIRASGMSVREMDAAEKAAFRAATYAPARDAYLARSGAEGAELLALYETIYEQVMQ